jgi:Flp pilus assembly pilin Flp
MRGKLPSTNQQLARLWMEREGGQTAAEYAVVLSVITLTIVTTLAVMSGSIQGILGQIVGLFS